MQAREKVAKSRNTVFFVICGSGGSKSRLAKAAGAEPSGEMGEEKLHAPVARRSQKCKKLTVSDHVWKLRWCTPLWREAHVEVNIYKTLHVGSIFRS